MDTVVKSVELECKVEVSQLDIPSHIHNYKVEKPLKWKQKLASLRNVN